MGRKKTDNEAIMMRVRPELAKRIDELATKYDISSRNQLVVEVVEMYLDFWVYAQEAKATAHRQQITAMKKNIKTSVVTTESLW